MSLCRQFLRAPRLLSQCQRLSALSQQRCHESTGHEDVLFTFISPSDVFYKEKEVKQIDVPSMDSTFGILKEHVPTIAVLKPGVITVYENEGTKQFFVSSGSITVNADSTVQVLAEEAHPLERFDQQTVSKALEAAQNTLSAASETDKAEAQIAVDCLETLSKSLQ